jgi:hypothetical protein
VRNPIPFSRNGWNLEFGFYFLFQVSSLKFKVLVLRGCMWNCGWRRLKSVMGMVDAIIPNRSTRLHKVGHKVSQRFIMNRKEAK